MNKRLLLSVAALTYVILSFAQNRDIRRELEENRNRYGGSSAPYEFVRQDYHTPPEGYSPFYISHFGRHGSRMHTSKDMFGHLNKVFSKADSLGILTPDGHKAASLFLKAQEAMKDSLGELTSVGEDEHREIARRMFKNFSEVFTEGPENILAQSTKSGRVIKSMNSFCGQLKDLNPALEIKEETDDRTNQYLNHYTPEYKEYYKNGPWREVRDNWERNNIDISSLTDRLFTSAEIFSGKKNGHSAIRFAQDLYSLAKIMPASGLGFGFYDFFTEDELYSLWQYGNMDQYMRKGPSGLSEGLAPGIAKPLLQDFIDKAERQIHKQTICADLRFGHGEGLMPLSALMQIEEASAVTSNPDEMYRMWQDYRVTTMAANIQWIFFKDKSGNVIVKIMFNEREARIPVATDIWPYYHWKDVLDFYRDILDASIICPASPSAKEINSSDIGQLYGVYYINSFDDMPQSKAPAGYKAIHISHYGRHGARYQDKERAYTTIIDKLAAGHENNALTQFGESVYKRLDAFYRKCRGHEGELTGIGWEQHRKIAHQTYELYPSIFRKNPEITACSSMSNRCIMSMSSFCLGLKEKNPGLDVYAQCSRTLLDEVNPSDKANTNYKERPLMEWPWNEDYDKFLDRRISTEEAETITARLFNDLDYARNTFNCKRFTASLYNLISGIGCVAKEDCIDDIFTEDELFDYFETINVGYFEWGAIRKEYAVPMLNCIIDDAREDFAKDRPTVRLRFGHDTCLQALLHLLDIDGMGTVPDSIDDLSRTWHCWKTPMASTLEFVFYRNRTGDILFKGVLNGIEVRIGVLEAVSGPYYRWSDLQKLYRAE